MTIRDSGPESNLPRTEPRSGEVYRLGALSLQSVVPSAWTNGAYFIVEQTVDARTAVSPHVHTHEDQVNYVLEGTIGFKAGDDEVVLGVGGAVMKPRGIPHTLFNPTDEPARMLEITSPGVIEALFKAMTVLTLKGPTAGEDGKSLGAKYGISNIDGWLPYLEEKYGVHLAGGPIG